jgi:hypothetical protein
MNGLFILALTFIASAVSIFISYKFNFTAFQSVVTVFLSMIFTDTTCIAMMLAGGNTE